MATTQIAAQAAPERGSPLEVLGAFLRLGLTAFGGPVAHLGYFREEFVTRRRWLDEATYADLVALCQFLPGPASSQVGFGLGLLRAGPLGALAAWTGFTLPSALLMVAAAYAATAMSGPLAQGLIHGLKLVAVAVVAQAVFGMARSLTPDARRAGIALAAVAIVTFASAAIGQVAAIALGVVAGLMLCRAEVLETPTHRFPIPRRVGLAALALYLALLLGGPLVAAATGAPRLAWFDAFYRSGALVFGGGHVVLPLLKAAVVGPGWVSPDSFLAGYGAAQAMPGPLFTFAAYLGAAMGGPAGAAIGLVGIFLPGLLALTAALPFWAQLRARPSAQAALRGANAAVVGILGAALYNPVWTSAVLGPADFAQALAGFVLLTAFRAPPILVVALGAAAGVARALWLGPA
ncbi:chromate efflux transporter [Caulobacter sp. KR2-114]|uniref:chromate efflux transporter n=1 Tax=Caulobacter sp. KR2-114 TaxID=3400912 RepID=UPI003C05491A